MRTGARRQTNWSQDWNRDGRVDNLDTQISQRFRGYDMNNDNRVARSEWPGDARLFTRLDTNRDGYLTMQEYTQGGGFTLDAQGGPSFRFSNIDMNNDGWVTRNEWNMGSADFTRLDLNRDNRISRFEFENDTRDNDTVRAQFNVRRQPDGWLTRPNRDGGEFDGSTQGQPISRFEFDNVATASNRGYDRFATVDVNHDGWLDARNGAARSRVHPSRPNRDNRLSRTEYDAEVTTKRLEARRGGPATTAACRKGARPAARTTPAGRDGISKASASSSGPTRDTRRRSGSLSDYQAGYREGFRNAYRAGFTEAGGRAPQ